MIRTPFAELTTCRQSEREPGRTIYTLKDGVYTLEDRPLAWQKRGLQQTASGYGRKLTSTKVVRLQDGRVRRVYVTCYSNAGTAWINLDGHTFVVVRD